MVFNKTTSLHTIYSNSVWPSDLISLNEGSFSIFEY